MFRGINKKLKHANPKTSVIPAPGRCWVFNIEPIMIKNIDINPDVFNVRFIAK